MKAPGMEAWDMVDVQIGPSATPLPPDEDTSDAPTEPSEDGPLMGYGAAWAARDWVEAWLMG